MSKKVSKSNAEKLGKSSEFTNAEILMSIWDEHLEGTKAQQCNQLCERVFGLLSLMALEETRPIFEQLWEVIDFDELYTMIGKYGSTGIHGPNKGFDEGEIF